MAIITRGSRGVDRVFLVAVLLLSSIGILIFTSASLGLITKGGASFGKVAFNQVVLGMLLGLAGMYFVSRIDYRFWRKSAFYFFTVALLLNLLVFIPGLGLTHGGATRWIEIGSLSFQPSEFLKVAFVLYFAAWLSGSKVRLKSIKSGLIPFIAILSVVGAVLFAQRDTDTFFVIVATGAIMYVVSGGKLKHLLLLAVIFLLSISVLAFSRPYLMDRLITYINPASDPTGSGYQIQQSLIAIGAGGLTGRGFGQSVQKFKYLPEPIGDSIFSVAAEEFGFIGSVAIIMIFIFFAVRGLQIAGRSTDLFGGLTATGIVTMILIQSFMNIAAMIGIVPLSGMPLIFISHGGTALLIALLEVGIVLNISRYRRE